jgi:hypothetical protein
VTLPVQIRPFVRRTATPLMIQRYAGAEHARYPVRSCRRSLVRLGAEVPVGITVASLSYGAPQPTCWNHFNAISIFELANFRLSAMKSRIPIQSSCCTRSSNILPARISLAPRAFLIRESAEKALTPIALPLPPYAAHRRKMDDAYTIPTAVRAMQAADKPESIDLSHHLSELAKARISSPLKVRRPFSLSLCRGGVL